jgi:hypothetical protein
MFFSDMEEFDVESCIEKSFDNLKEFKKSVEDYECLVLQGFGYCTYKSPSYGYQGYHIIIINNDVFAFVGQLENSLEDKPSVNDELLFHKVVKLNDKLLGSGNFDTYFTDNKLEYLDAALAVDGILYEYSDLDKYIISKKGVGNIDMFATYSLSKDLKLKAFVQDRSLHLAAKHQLMSNILDERMNAILAQKTNRN